MKQLYIENLLQNDKHVQAVKVLKQEVSDPQEALEIVQRLSLRGGKLSKSEAYVLFLKAAKMILDSKIPANDSVEKQDLYERINKIARKFQLRTVHDIIDKAAIPATIEIWLGKEPLQDVYAKMLKIAELLQEPPYQILDDFFRILIKTNRFTGVQQCLNAIAMSGQSCEKLLAAVENHLLSVLESNADEVLNSDLILALAKVASLSVVITKEADNSASIRSSWLSHIVRLQTIHEPDQPEKARLSKHQFKVGKCVNLKNTP